MRRLAVEVRSVAIPHRRQEHSRSVGHVDRRIRRVGGPHGRDDVRTRVAHSAGSGQGDPRAAALPARSGAGLSVAGPLVAVAVGRRKPAHPAGDADRLEAGERALYSGRTLHRSAPARQPAAYPQPGRTARRWQLGHRGGARRGDDARGRLHCGRGSQGRAPGRPHRSGGHAGRHLEVRFGDGRLSDGPPPHRNPRKTARGHGRKHRNPGRTGQQPEKHRRRIPAGQTDLRDGSERFWQVDPCERNAAPDSC